MKKELNQIRESGKLTMFEIEVIDKRTSEKEFILCDIDTDEFDLFCTHVGINKAEEEGRRIARTSIPIDTMFSIDEHLEDLYSEVIEKICNSDIYSLKDN